MTASLPPGQLSLAQLWPPTCGAGQPVIREPLAGSSLSSKSCSCHLGQAGSMWPVPAKSLSVFKVESWYLFPFLIVCSSETHDTLETHDMLGFISLMIVQPAQTCELSILLVVHFKRKVYFSSDRCEKCRFKSFLCNKFARTLTKCFL